MHSIYSDGKLRPKNIVEIAKNNKVDIISLTDHDSTAGVDQAIYAGEKLGVKVIPGVEISSRYENAKVHILGYFKDDSYKNELFKQVLNAINKDDIRFLKEIFGSSIDFNGYTSKLYVKTTIDILKFFGAIVILAHPVRLSRDVFNKINGMGFDGIEAKYYQNTPQDTEFFINFANTHNMIYTAGSDFHKNMEKYRASGYIGQVYLEEDEIRRFLNLLGIV